MTHTHYIAVDVTKELPTKSGWYHTEFTDDEGTKVIGRAHWNNDVQFFQSQAYHDGSKVLVETWLKPCTETGAVDTKALLEWMRKHVDDEDVDGHCLPEGKWLYVKSHNLKVQIVTFDQLLEIFKAESK